MKRITLLLAAMATAGMTAQEYGAVTTSDVKTEKTSDYNKWSIDLGAGVNKPLRPMRSGYYTKTPDFLSAQAGVRYMFNNKFGLKANVAYNEFSDASNSLPFKSEMWSYGLDGVVNLGNVLDFKSWTNTIGLLAHAGASYATLKGIEPIKSGTDEMVTVNVGLQPQIRLGNRIALFLDASLHGNVRQGLGFEGQPRSSSPRGFDGYFMTTTAGISIYLGGNDKHADWTASSNNTEDLLADMDQRLSKVETDLIDSDQDGVPDYLDREPNTPSGVMVDTKGRAIDVNQNGIPDELENALDRRYSRLGSTQQGESSSAGTIHDLINNGYVNVYFKFDSTQPEVYSLEAINYLVTYMKENTSAEAELIGYADAIGNANYNTKLSENRAKAVYDILIASGVDAGRLSYTGSGSDDSVDSKSAPARQLVRRVTFKLK